MEEPPLWEEMTDGQKDLARESERGEHSAMATLAFISLIIAAPIVLFFPREQSQLHLFAWVTAFVALWALMQTKTKGETAAQYRRWLASYDAEMRRTGKYDRGEPH